MERIRKLARCLAELLSVAVFTPVGRLLRLLSPRWRAVWLIAERGREARDNAWHLFQYLVREHPEINAVYMIDKRSPDLEKVRAVGPIAYRGSLRHRLLMGAAERLVSTHIMGYTPDLGAYFRLDRLKLVPGIKIFLQHGIIYNDLKFMYYPKTRCDLFVCAARREYEFIKGRFGHADGVPQLLGLCRYDALYRAPAPAKRQILLMPTWREWLALHDAGDFRETAYFAAMNGLLNAPRLHDMLKTYDCELAFYPHYEMQRFLGAFSCDCPRVRVLGLQGNDVQRLLIESSVLVTDYSSVFFDFAYMRKPTVYYQFDEEEFRTRQCGEGYFNYRDDGFGAVCPSLDAALDAVEALLRNGCRMAERDEARADAFFTLRDGENCRRNFEAIRATAKHRE